MKKNVLQTYFAVKRALFRCICKIPFGIGPREKNKTILVFRSAALGDFVMSLPALKLLRSTYPTHRILLLTISSASKNHRKKVTQYTGSQFSLPWIHLVEPELIDKVIVLSSLSVWDLWRHTRPAILREAPEACFVLTDPAAPGLGVLKKILLLKFMGAFCTIYGWQDVSSISRWRQEQHEMGLLGHHVLGPIRSVLESPRTMKLSSIEVDFTTAVSKGVPEWVEEYWTSHGLAGKHIVAVAIGSIQPHKKWPIDKFAEVCRFLLQSPDVAILIIGTLGDQKDGEKIVALAPSQVHNFAGKTSIVEAAAILGKCRLLIGNDGGAMHLGDAVGCQTISIMPGIEYPGSVEPWNSVDWAVRHETACSPCYNFHKCPKGHNRCMVELPVQVVVSQVQMALESPNRLSGSPPHKRLFQVIRDKQGIQLQEILK